MVSPHVRRWWQQPKYRPQADRRDWLETQKLLKRRGKAKMGQVVPTHQLLHLAPLPCSYCIHSLPPPILLSTADSCTQTPASPCSYYASQDSTCCRFCLAPEQGWQLGRGSGQQRNVWPVIPFTPNWYCAPARTSTPRHSGDEQHAGGRAEEDDAELHGCKQLLSRERVSDVFMRLAGGLAFYSHCPPRRVGSQFEARVVGLGPAGVGRNCAPSSSRICSTDSSSARLVLLGL